MRRPLFTRLDVERLEPRDTPAVIYVAPNGADGNTGGVNAPLLTLQAAAGRVAPGDTVIVRAGTYRGFNLTTSGAAAARITFQADPAAGAGGVTINLPNPWNNLDGINLEGASYVTVDGFTVIGQPRAGIRAVENGFVVIRNNTADANTKWGIFTGFSSDLLIENNQASRSAQEHGIYVSNSADRPVVRGNTAFGNRGGGIQLNADGTLGGDGIISNAVIENNILRDNGAGGGASINLDGVQDSDIRNNMIQSARASGIALFRQNGSDGAKNNRLVNNTVVVDYADNVAAGRWAVTISGGSTGTLLRNNILFSTQSFRGAISVAADSMAGLASDYNAVENRLSNDDGGTGITLAAWQSATGQDLNSVSLADVNALNALFVNRVGYDYHLTAGSMAIDRGAAAAPATDFEGQARPSGAGVDIGADEFLTVTSPAVTTLSVNAIGIASATDAAGLATVTTVAPHGLLSGQTVTIAGVSQTGYNGTFAVSVIDRTRFTYLYTVTGPLLNGSGGTAARTVAASPAFRVSRLTSLAVAFNTPVTIAAGAFTLTNGAQTMTSATGGGIAVAGSGTLRVTLSFSGAGVESGSLADGVWTLTVDRTKVTNTSCTAMAADFTKAGIGRLFGDYDGNGVVNFDDQDQFGNTFGLSSGVPGFLPAFDYDGNGVINFDDQDQFGNRIGMAL